VLSEHGTVLACLLACVLEQLPALSRGNAAPAPLDLEREREYLPGNHGRLISPSESSVTATAYLTFPGGAAVMAQP